MKLFFFPSVILLLPLPPQAPYLFLFPASPRWMKLTSPRSASRWRTCLGKGCSHTSRASCGLTSGLVSALTMLMYLYVHVCTSSIYTCAIFVNYNIHNHNSKESPLFPFLYPPPSPRVCSLSTASASRGCTHRLRLADSNQCHYISYHCRNRVREESTGGV